MDLELHQRVIMRIPRHTDVSMTLGIYVNPVPMATREVQRGLGEPFDAQVKSRLRCCTCRILLLYFQQQRLPPNRCEPLACGNTSRGDRI